MAIELAEAVARPSGQHADFIVPEFADDEIRAHHALAAGAATTWILVQALVNIGAVVGLVPITGIPLPLVSYGGSALLPTMIALGMLLSFARLDALGLLGASSRRRRPPPSSRTRRRPPARPGFPPPTAPGRR